jgi:hypothetical protein
MQRLIFLCLVKLIKKRYIKKKGEIIMSKNRASDSNDSIQQQINKKQNEKDMEKAPGFGDKKLEGPNKPSV